jgi:hypothetical protein
MSTQLSEPQLDPMGALIVEAREDIDVFGLVGERVRGFEPAPETTSYDGDARGPGQYISFVVFAALDVPPHPGVPVTFADYAVNAYGTDHRNAWQVWGALVKAFHKRTARLKANGLGIYQTLVVSGGTQDRDPDTRQPVVRGTLRVIASTLDAQASGS